MRLHFCLWIIQRLIENDTFPRDNLKLRLIAVAQLTSHNLTCKITVKSSFTYLTNIYEIPTIFTSEQK